MGGVVMAVPGNACVSRLLGMLGPKEWVGLLKSEENVEGFCCMFLESPPRECSTLYPSPNTIFLNFQGLCLYSLLSIFPSMTPVHFSGPETVFILALPTHLQKKPSMLWIRKTKESFNESLQMTIWMRDNGKCYPHTFSTSLQYRWTSHWWCLSPWKVLLQWVVYCSEQRPHVYL